MVYPISSAHNSEVLTTIKTVLSCLKAETTYDILSNVITSNSNHYLLPQVETGDNAEIDTLSVYVLQEYLPITTVINTIAYVVDSSSLSSCTDAERFEIITDNVEKLLEKVISIDANLYGDNSFQRSLINIEYDDIYSFIGVHRNRIPFIVYSYLTNTILPVEILQFVDKYHIETLVGLDSYILDACSILGINMIPSYDNMTKVEVMEFPKESFKVPKARTLTEETDIVSRYEGIVTNYLRGNDYIFTPDFNLSSSSGSLSNMLMNKTDEVLRKITITSIYEPPLTTENSGLILETWNTEETTIQPRTL